MKQQKLAVLEEKRQTLERHLHTAEQAAERDIKCLEENRYISMPAKLKRRMETRVEAARSRCENLRQELRFLNQWINDIQKEEVTK